jgi:hypothetical protein
MTVSPASRVAAVFAFAVLSGAASAQQAPPATPVPIFRMPAPAGPAPAEPVRAAPGRSDLPVTVDRLAAVDPDSVGLIAESDGGLGVDLWKGTPRALAVALVQALPAPVESAAMRSLARRLLLTTAAAPQGTSTEGPLLLARARKLVELGHTAEAVELVRAAPANAVDENLVQVKVEGLFFANNNSGACSRVRGVDFAGAHWQQALAYCLALAGESEKSSMIADLLREREQAAPPAFFGLMDAIGGDRNAKVELDGEPSALLLSMMRAANRKLPEKIARSERVAVLRMVALAPNADLAVRLAAAERAEALGAITADELAQIQSGVSFTADEIGKARSIAESRWGPRARSLLLRVALAQNAPAARVEAVRAAFTLAREKDELAVARRVMVPAFAGIQPAPDTMDFAAEAGAALYAVGRIKQADGWYTAVEREAPNNAQAARGWTVLWPLNTIAGGASVDPTLVARWRNAAVGGGADDAARNRAALVLALLEALGQKLPDDAWPSLVRGGRAAEATPPDPAVWHALERASRDGRRGEAVSLALLAIGPRGPASAGALTMPQVITALRRAGLEADARALALEAAAGG